MLRAFSLCMCFLRHLIHGQEHICALCTLFLFRIAGTGLASFTRRNTRLCLPLLIVLGQGVIKSPGMLRVRTNIVFSALALPISEQALRILQHIYGHFLSIYLSKSICEAWWRCFLDVDIQCFHYLGLAACFPRRIGILSVLICAENSGWPDGFVIWTVIKYALNTICNKHVSVIILTVWATLVPVLTAVLSGTSPLYGQNLRSKRKRFWRFFLLYNRNMFFSCRE